MLERIAPRLLQSEPMRRCQLEECQAACCLHGVWIDLAEVQELRRNAALIQPHMPEDLRDPDLWFEDQQEDDEHALSGRVIHSTVLPSDWHYGATACVFLRRDFKCALQVASESAGYAPWRFKPFYCILHPLDLDESGRITLDETEQLLAEPASCLRPAEREAPLAETFEPELSYFLGAKGYQELLDMAKKPDE